MSTFVDMYVIEIMANDFDIIRHYDIIDNVNRLTTLPQVVGYANRGRLIAYARTLSGVSIRTLINAHHDYVMHVVLK